MRLGFSLGVFCAVVGCGAPASQHPANEARIAPAPNISNAATQRRPSSAIARHWPFQRPPSFSLYADLQGFTRTEVFRTFAISAMTMARGHIGDDQETCIRTLVANARELAFGYEEDGSEGVFVLAFAPELRERAPDCLRRFGSKPGPTISGAKEVHDFGTTVIAFDDDVAVGGSKPLVEAAFAQSANGSGPTLALGPDEYVSWIARKAELTTSGTLLASRERFRLAVTLDLKNEKAASEVGGMLDRGKEGLGQMGGSQERELGQHLLEALQIKRDGNHFDIRFELVKSPEEQAKDIGMAAALGIYGVRRYLSRAKQSEARNALGAVARGYMSWWEREDISSNLKKPTKKKLFSLGAVPTEVPRGKKYQSAEGEWKGWQNIGFSLSEPQYFQYEVKASKDGESADIIAHGDLNGDGKPSTFTLRMKVDRKTNTLSVAPEIEEADPDE